MPQSRPQGLWSAQGVGRALSHRGRSWASLQGGIHSHSGETLLEGVGERDWQQGLRLDTNTRICDDVHWCFLSTSKGHPCRATRLQTGATDVGSAGCEPGSQQQSGPPLGISRPFLASGPFCMFLGVSGCFRAGRQGELATSVSAPPPPDHGEAVPRAVPGVL